MTPRRQQILDIAAEMFAQRGFHGVSVVDLGAACGISGPALYKHFPSKEAMLAEMLVSISERLLDEGTQRAHAAPTGREAVVALVEWHISFALEHRALIVVQDRDWTSLAREARERVRGLQRRYVDLWANELMRVDEDLDPQTARARAHVVFGLINSTPHSGRLPDDEMRALLRTMALGALGIS